MNGSLKSADSPMHAPFIFRLVASVIDLIFAIVSSVIIVELFGGVSVAIRFLESFKIGQPEESTLFDPFWYGIWYLLICLYSLPLLVVLIIMAPNSLGRKWMRLEVRTLGEQKLSVDMINVIRLRESVKWLWLLPGIWLLFGLVPCNIEALSKDILASIRLFPMVLLFPMALSLWIGSFGRISVHDLACGTYSSTKMAGVTPLTIILVILVSALFAIVIWFLDAKISFHSSWTSYSMTEYSNGPYSGEPRFALPMAVYSVLVFSWTYLVYGMRKRRERAIGSQVGEETNEG